jgi:hypothetical protein
VSDTAAVGFDGTELDFWLGEWQVSWDGGHGTNRVTRILGDQVLLEEFEEAPSADGTPTLHGRSWSVFDPARGLWRQTWVDNQGSYLDLVGETVDGSFAFGRAAPERGPTARQRMVFRDLEPDRFRWTWESSPDDGATWLPRWEIAYTR